MKNNDLFEWIGCGIGTVLTAVQTQEIFQIISLILTCLATLTTLAYTVWKWYKKAKSDGKITPDEIVEIVDETTEQVKELKNKIGEKQNGKDK